MGGGKSQNFHLLEQNLKSSSKTPTPTSMKNMILLLLSLSLNLSLFAQQSLSEKIINITWTLQSDEMSGMGTHQSLAAKTTLVLDVAGQWKSSNSINGLTSGTWKMDKKGRLILQLDKKKRGFCDLEGALFVVTVPGVGKERRMVWGR
jgi:hypothetical protein